MLLAYIYRSITHRVHFLDKASRDLFICAKDLLVEADPARASLHRLSKGNILLPNIPQPACQGYMERDTAATAVVSAGFMRPGASLAIDSVETPAVMVCSASSLTVAGAAASELQTAKTCF